MIAEPGGERPQLSSNEPQHNPEIAKYRVHTVDTIREALGNQIRSRNDVGFQGHIGPAQFTGLTMVHIPEHRQESGEGSPWRLRLDGYVLDVGAKSALPAEPLLDTNGLKPAVVELFLDEHNPELDRLRISPTIIIAMEYAYSPQGVMNMARMNGQPIPTQEEAEKQSSKLRREQFEKHHEAFNRATTRKPSLNDYKVFNETANVINEIRGEHGLDIFQAIDTTNGR